MGVHDLLIIFCIQTAISALGTISSVCNRTEETDKKKKIGASATNLIGLMLGVFGICAILYDCFQLLMASVVLNFVVIIGAALMLVLMVVGFCVTLGDKSMCLAVCGIVTSSLVMALSVALQIAMLAFSFPFIQNHDF